MGLDTLTGSPYCVPEDVLLGACMCLLSELKKGSFSQR